VLATDDESVEHDVQVMIEGPGTFRWTRSSCSEKKWSCGTKRRFTRGALVIDIAPGYDHITARIGAAMIGWHGASMPVLTSRRSASGLQAEGREAGRDRHTKIAAHAPMWRGHRPGARDRDDALSYARFLFDWTSSSIYHSTPETARAMHDETLPDDFYKDAKFCSMCGPKFCSMNMTQQAESLLTAKISPERQQKFVELPRENRAVAASSTDFSLCGLGLRDRKAHRQGVCAANTTRNMWQESLINFCPDNTTMSELEDNQALREEFNRWADKAAAKRWKKTISHHSASS